MVEIDGIQSGSGFGAFTVHCCSNGDCGHFQISLVVHSGDSGFAKPDAYIGDCPCPQVHGGWPCKGTMLEVDEADELEALKAVLQTIQSIVNYRQELPN